MDYSKNGTAKKQCQILFQHASEPGERSISTYCGSSSLVWLLQGLWESAPVLEAIKGFRQRPGNHGG